MAKEQAKKWRRGVILAMIRLIDTGHHSWWNLAQRLAKHTSASPQPHCGMRPLALAVRRRDGRTMTGRFRNRCSREEPACILHFMPCVRTVSYGCPVCHKIVAIVSFNIMPLHYDGFLLKSHPDGYYSLSAHAYIQLQPTAYSLQP